MDELVPLFDGQGSPLQVCALKSEAHLKAWWHGTVHLWMVAPGGRLIFQKRSRTKSSFPGLWDVSVAGHMTGWESPMESVIRECHEELGWEAVPDQLKFVGQFKSEFRHRDGLLDREFNHAYVYREPIDPVRLRPDPMEVEAVEAFPLESLLKASESGLQGFVPHGKRYAETIINVIRALSLSP